MAATARAPRRGESGFAAEMRRRGGDPRLRPAAAPQPPETPPATPQRTRGAAPARSRLRATTGRMQRAGRTSVRPRGLRRLVAPASGPVLTVGDASGFVLGVLAWVLVLQYLRDGPKGVRDWLRAKFLNKDPQGRPLP